MIVCSATLHSFDVKKLAERIMHFPIWVDLKVCMKVFMFKTKIVLKLNYDNYFEVLGDRRLHSSVVICLFRPFDSWP